jgi:hypothetical protein
LLLLVVVVVGSLFVVIVAAAYRSMMPRTILPHTVVLQSAVAPIAHLLMFSLFFFLFFFLYTVLNGKEKSLYMQVRAVFDFAVMH